MHDPRFANAGAAPFVAGGFAAPAAPVNYHHHRHRHHKHKSRKDQSPLSRDESIHKVDHGQTHAFQQNDGIPYGTGYGVPYGVPTGFGMPGAAGLPQMYPQQSYQQAYPTVPFQYQTQFGGAPYVQESFVPAGRPKKHHRRHHRRHHPQQQQQQQQQQGGQGFEEVHDNVDGARSVPEQLIGQRSSSVVGSDPGPVRSPVLSAEGETKHDFGGQPDHHHHHHRHRHRHHGQGGQSQQFVGSDGYGHINEELIFIERGDHSPHRQDTPKGYDYKGKIEVQCANRETRSQSRGRNTFFPSPQHPTVPTVPTNIPMPPPVVPQHHVGPCPPGWQQMMVSAAPGGPCPPGAGMFSGQMFGPTGFPQPSFNPLAPTMGPVNTGGGLANLAATLPLSAQGQIVADYIVESKGSGGGGGATGVVSGGGSPTNPAYQTTQHQQGTGDSFYQHHQEEHVSGRPTVIEVWQKRSKSETREKSRSRSRSRSLSPERPHHHHHHHHHRERGSRSPTKPGSSLDLDRFRNEILSAIEKMVHRGGGSTIIKPGGQENGSQTHIQRPRSPDRPSGPTGGGSGEVRVIVQPIQPVFYMPRQTSGSSGVTPQIPGNFGGSDRPQPAPPGGGGGGGSNVVYVPRNVYVPVIKPVFVPRERVIVRPQVIHVARPVLVDRPVPVTQRPIIIDRERPVPVPVRGGAQEATQSGAANVTREEYVYRDNLPVAYGGRCAEFAGGVNYGYMPTQQEHHYGASSTHEVQSHYQNQGPVINVTAPEQFQHSQSSSHIEVRPDASSFHGSYSNLARANSASAVNVGHMNQEVIQQTFEQSARIAGVPADCPTQIEVLDPAVNPFWQKTDQSTLMRRYGRPAYEIVHKTDEVEQQMYNELRQSGNLVGGNVQRSSSAASYASGSGVAGLDAGIPHY